MPTNRLVVKEQIATYTSVLFEAAAQQGQDALLQVRTQLHQIVSIIRGNADLQAALKDSSYSGEQREVIARGTFADAYPALNDVLAVMASRGEIDLLSRVADQFEDMLADKLNLCVVEVTTAVALDDHLREVVTNKAATELGMNVVLDEHVDPSILGGIVMSTNNERIDASVLSQLESARTVLKK